MRKRIQNHVECCGIHIVSEDDVASRRDVRIGVVQVVVYKTLTYNIEASADGIRIGAESLGMDIPVGVEASRY